MTDPPVAALSEPVAGEAADSGTGSIIRSSSVVGAGTLLSRITGMVRTIAIAVVLGGKTLADGYNLANTTPNMIYDLLLGGVFSATLVPIFVDHREHDDPEGTNAVVTIFVSALVALTVAAVVAAPWIFRLYTWRSSPAQRAANLAIGVPLLRWFLPQILFYGLTALASAMLNARRSYLAPAFAPVLNNVVVLCMLGMFWHLGGTAPSVHRVLHDRTLFLLLAAGTTSGIVVMALALWPALRRAGVHLRWRFDLHHASVRRVFSLSGWTLAYALVNQVALAVVLALAAPIKGQVTAYTYAFMVFQLPYGLFAVSIMTTVEPELAHCAARSDHEGFRRQFASGLRLLLVVMVPSSVGCALVARPLATLLFDHGAYRQAAPLTGDLLLWFSVGLVGFAVYLYALRAFYALKDTRTPFLVNVLENAVNVLVALAVVGRFHARGLAAAYSVAYLVASVVALAAVRRRIGSFEGRRTAAAFGRVVGAAAAMAVAVAAALWAVGSRPGFAAALPTGAAVVVGTAVFGVAATVLRVDEVHLVLDRFRRRAAR